MIAFGIYFSCLKTPFWIYTRQTCPGLNSAVVEEILLNLPAEEVVLNCRLVCREWKELVDTQSYWIKRCQRAGIKPCDASRHPEDWHQFYFMFTRNLLKNPRSEAGLNGWEYLCGDVRKYYQRQLINLEIEGYSPAFMDHRQPDIKISDWYAPESNDGCCYEIWVKLLDQNKEPLREPNGVFRYEPINIEQCDVQQCYQKTHVFKDYGPGARFICFTHGGFDTGNWTEAHGIRAIHSSVKIIPD